MTWVKEIMIFYSNNDQDKESQNTTITHDREVPKKDIDSMDGLEREKNQEKAIKNREQACNTLRVSKMGGDIYSLIEVYLIRSDQRRDQRPSEGKRSEKITLILEAEREEADKERGEVRAIMLKARELIKGSEYTPSIKEMTELIETEEKNKSVKMDWLIQRIEGLGVEKNEIEIEKIKGVNFITIRSTEEVDVEEIIKFTREHLDKKSKEIQENALILMRAVKVMIGEFNMGNSSVCDVKCMFVTQAASQTTYHLARTTMEAVKRMNSDEGASRMQAVKLFGEKIEGEGTYLIQIDGVFNESIAFGRDMTKEMMLSLIKRNKKIS
jgi:hypothetical protein